MKNAIALLIPLLFTFSSTMAAEIQDPTYDRYVINENGDFVFMDGNTALETDCDKSTTSQCASIDIVMDGLNQSTDYTNKSIDKAKQDIYNYISETGVTQDYVDAGDSAIKSFASEKATNAENSANQYTEGKITETKNELNKSIDNAQSEAITTANDYTDSRITDNNTIINQNIENSKSEAISTANNYTDSRITDNNTIINQNIENSKSEAISTANNYTDSRITDNNTVINQNIDNSKREAISISNDYTDNKHKQSIEYTDNKYQQSINYAQNAANNAEQNSKTYTDTTIKQLSNSSNRRFEQLDNKIDRAEKRLNAGVAGVTAIASIPYVAENSFSYGIGLGNYQNGNALAAGIQYKTTPNTNIRLNASWDSSNNAALGVGLAGGW